MNSKEQIAYGLYDFSSSVLPLLADRQKQVVPDIEDDNLNQFESAFDAPGAVDFIIK